MFSTSISSLVESMFEKCYVFLVVCEAHSLVLCTSQMCRRRSDIVSLQGLLSISRLIPTNSCEDHCVQLPLSLSDIDSSTSAVSNGVDEWAASVKVFVLAIFG